MLTNHLIDHPWFSPSVLLLCVVAAPTLGAWLVGRPRMTQGLLILSLVPLAALTLIPVDRELYFRCEVAWSIPTVGRVELAANVVLFIVPVLLAAIAWRKPVVAAVAGILASAGIEAVQGAVTGLGRSCSTNDWLANSIGAVIGGLLGAIALAVFRLRARS